MKEKNKKGKEMRLNLAIRQINVLQVGTDERFFKIKLLGKAIVK